jgi:type I restriction enzyme S subunit
LKQYQSNGCFVPQLPEGWELKPIRSVASYRISTVDKLSLDDEFPVRLCNYTDVYNNPSVQPSMDLMQATATQDEIARFRLVEGDVVITKDSEGWDDIAIPTLVTESAPDFVCGYHLAIIRPDPKRVLGEYLLRSIQADGIKQQFQLAASSGVTRYGIPKAAIGKAHIPVPPPDEQRSICSFLTQRLGRIDQLIEKKQLLIDLLGEKRTAAIHHTVTKGASPNGPLKDVGLKWAGHIPADWNVKRIKWVARMESGHTPDKKVAEYWRNCDIPWVSLRDTDQLRVTDYISDTTSKVNALGIENSSARILPAGAVVFSRDATIGLCAITARPMAVSQHFIAWLCGDEILPEYLLFALRAMTSELERVSAGATIATIGMPEVQALRTPIPPLHEQLKITGFIKQRVLAIGNTTRKIEEQISRLREYRAALITAAVTGQLDLRKHEKQMEAIA